MKKVIASLLLLVTLPTQAEQSVIGGCFSYHIDRDMGFNENNICLGYKKDNFFGLVFKNSENDTTLLVGHDLTLGRVLGLDAGLVWGVAVGYERYPVMPVVAPKLDYNITKDLTAKFTLLPYQHPAISLSFEYSF